MNKNINIIFCSFPRCYIVKNMATGERLGVFNTLKEAEEFLKSIN